MKNAILIAAIGAMLLATSGCGACRNWFRGSACNSCQPPMAQPCGMNTAGSCMDGNCGTGVDDQNPASIPAANFGNSMGGVPYYNESGMETIPSSEVYGNSNMVTPPTIGPANGS